MFSPTLGSLDHSIKTLPTLPVMAHSHLINIWPSGPSEIVPMPRLRLGWKKLGSLVRLYHVPSSYKSSQQVASDYEQPKYPHENTLPEPSFLSSLGQARESLHVPAARSSPNLFQTEGSRQSTLIASCAHPQRAPAKTDTPQEATKAAKLYWCTICEDRHPYKNISDWRKHERGHVETYVCMLTGSVDTTQGRVKCSLCGMLNPSEKHLGEHNTQVCGQGVLGSFSCKRRADLVQHLRKYHNVLERAQGEAVADKWKETTKKQAWSCGFCAELFHTFGDRLKHIATHFERGQTLDEWDITQVIEGLLKQPEMINVWRMPLDWRFSEITWKKDAIKDVQHALELGPSGPVHAKDLVQAVYNARQSDRHVLNDDFAFAGNYEALETSALAPTSYHTSTSNRMFQPSSNHQQSQFINPAETVHNDAPAPGGDLMARNDYGCLPFSFSDDDRRPVLDPWQLIPGQTRSSAADPYIGYV